MPDAILIFTFSPVQSFIAEARRAADLCVGSQILVQLARAAGKAIQVQGGVLIYPASEALKKPKGDVPNKLVARIPWEAAGAIAEAAQRALVREWKDIANSARTALMCNWGLGTDACWEAIWKRQTESLWEIYWAADQMPDGDYARAYRDVGAALDARKRSRVFAPANEEGIKDSLSGCREALHTQNMDARVYWKLVKVGPPRLRPDGRERLDAIGAIKRACRLAEQRFFSTSTVAAEDFLGQARPYLGDYRKIIADLLGSHAYTLRDDDPDWPYDGDLLFLETLTRDRLADSHGLKQLDVQRLEIARAKLQEVYQQAHTRPSPYYAILVLDGDNMGKRIDACLEENGPEAAHRALSERVSQFAEYVHREAVAPGFLMYAGGDDVLALAPLSQALPLAQTLAARFHEIVGGTASAGITVAHHLYPLDAALEAARAAEKQAKQVPGKAAVCVHVLKRSGETVEVRSARNAMGETFDRLVKLFQTEALSNKLAYAVSEATYALPDPDAMFEAELCRLLRRHRHPTKWKGCEAEWAATLRTWAIGLPGASAELGRWLILARFIAQGGGE